MSASRSRSDEVRHVIIVTNALAPDKLGGLERYVRELAAGLVRQGMRVTVVAKRVDPDHPARELGPDGVAIVRHDVPSKRLRTFALRYPLQVAAAVWREVGHPEPGTVVHAHYAMPALPLALAGIPYLYTFHAPVYREALNERLPASVICNSGLNYQVSFRPSSTLRLPPLKKVLFKNVGEVTKM